VVLDVHGGVCALGSARASAGLACLLARQARAKVLSVDYRLAPEHPYPAAPDDALASYRGLLDTGIRPERIALFGGLPAADRDVLFGHLQGREFARGQIIFSQGEPGDGLYILTRGHVTISRRAPDGGELILALCQPGEHFGELALFDDEPHLAGRKSLMIEAGGTSVTRGASVKGAISSPW